MEDEKILKNNNLKDKVLSKIETGEVQMRSKTYFILKVYLLIFVTILTCITSALLISYTLFNVSTQGELFLLSFGGRGLFKFILIFPWLILIVDLLLLVFLDWLLQRFKFGYDRPIIYLFSGTLIVITMFGSLINLTSFHSNMMRRAEGRNLPIFGSFYSNLRTTHKEQGMFRGVVSSIDGNTFTIGHNEYDTDSNEGLIKVIAPNDVKVSDFLNIGDQVFIAGDFVNNQIMAYGIHKILPN